MQFIFYIKCGFKTFNFKFTFYALYMQRLHKLQLYRMLLLDFRETV